MYGFYHVTMRVFRLQPKNCLVKLTNILVDLSPSNTLVKTINILVKRINFKIVFNILVKF